MVVDELLEETLDFLRRQRPLNREGRLLKIRISQYLEEFVENRVPQNNQEKILEILDRWLTRQASSHCEAAFNKALQSERAAEIMYGKYLDYSRDSDADQITRLRFFRYFSRGAIERLPL